MYEMKADSFALFHTEFYMTPHQLNHFRNKLLVLREQLSESTRNIRFKINQTDSRPIEEMERSVMSLERDVEFQKQTRNWETIRDIDLALQRIIDGTYGYCEETEEPIGIGRLEANPMTRFCLSVQEHFEMTGRGLNRRTF
jgi:DnaK suppressor protein